MTTPPVEPRAAGARDTDHWAQPVDRLAVAGLPPGALNLNVQGRRVTGPLQGFGKMWQKTYHVRLAGAAVTPAEVVTAWKEHLSSFWPPGTDSTPRSRGLPRAR